MKKINRSVIAIFVFALLLMNQAQAGLPLTQEEQNFSVLMNKFRTSLGLSSLMIHPALQSAATAHSEWMSQYNLLQHNGPYSNTKFSDRIISAGFNQYTYLAENIQCGSADAMSAFLQWVRSTPHLNNILNPHFKYMGIARAGNANQPCPFFWTNDFGSDTDGSLDVNPSISSAQILNAIEQIKNGTR